MHCARKSISIEYSNDTDWNEKAIFFQVTFLPFFQYEHKKNVINCRQSSELWRYTIDIRRDKNAKEHFNWSEIRFFFAVCTFFLLYRQYFPKNGIFSSNKRPKHDQILKIE